VGDDAPVNRSVATPVRLAEPVATLSLVPDLRLGDAAGVEASIRAAAYYTTWLNWVG
jgi:hypothetical protein